MSKTYYVYILRCSDNSYYTGITSNLFTRMETHQLGLERKGYTYSRRPVKLVYYEEFADVDYAIAREKQIKKWRRAKKDALIERQEDSLPQLSKRYTSNDRHGSRTSP